MLIETIKYIRRIPITMYIIGSVLFFTIIGLIPLLGYMISVSQERITKGVNSNPPNYESILVLTQKGIISFIIVGVTLIPSGIIYILMPILINIIDVESSTILAFILILIALLGILFSLTGLYLFSAMLFAYSRYSVDDELSALDAVLYTLFQICLSKTYIKSFVFIIVLSLLFGLITEVFFLSIILAPLASIVALIYFTSMGYIIGSLTTEFQPAYGLPIFVSYLRKLELSDLKQLIS